MTDRITPYKTAAEYIREQIKGQTPLVGVVLGSGLGSLADKIENPTVIPYKQIPGFPESTAIGHKGNLIFGDLAGKKVIAMQGRFHYYEGYTMQQVFGTKASGGSALGRLHVIAHTLPQTGQRAGEPAQERANYFAAK